LHLKKVGPYWSARVGLRYRALAVETDGAFSLDLNRLARRP
jgi:hypothetical protein